MKKIKQRNHNNESAMREIWEELTVGIYPSDELMERKRMTNGQMLDRHDLSGEFGPSNCFWCTYEEYINRRRMNN